MAKSKSAGLGKITALLLTAAMMVGTGIFTTLGEATTEARSGILVAMLIGAVIALMTGISAAQVGVNYPEEGGAFVWMRIFGHPTISFTAGISYLLKGIVGLSIAALGFGYYSSQLIHGLPIPIMASIALLTVATVNFFGISPTAKVIISIFFINLVLLALYVGLTIPNVRVENMTPIWGSSFTGVLSGAAAFFWSWDGFQRTAIMASEIKDPRKTIPLAIIGGISIAVIIYLIVAGTTLGVLGPDAMGKSDTPLFFGATKSIAGWGIWTIVLSAWILAFSDILGDLMSTSKVGHSMGQEHELPHWFGTVHKRLKSPQYMILLLTIIGMILVNLVPLRRLVPMASTCTLIWYTITHLSALKLNKERRFAWPIISLLGIVACIALLFSLPLWSVLGAVVLLALLVVIRSLIIRLVQKATVDTSGNWSVTGLTLAQGDIISVTAQYAGEAVSATASTIVAAAPLQTAAPVISLPITEADTTVSGKAPSGANVVFFVNDVAQKAITANGGNWTASGLTLVQGDLISVNAQSAGEMVSMTTTTTVTPAPFTSTELVISEAVTADNKTVSGRAPSGASVTLSINKKAEPEVIATDGKWTVSNLNLTAGDSISVAAKYGDETSNLEAKTTVAPAPPQTGEPVISRIVTAADTTVSGRAPSGAGVVLSVNGKIRSTVIASGGKIVSTATTTKVAPAPLQTTPPVISGIIKTGDKTISGTAPSGASIVLSVNGAVQPSVVATGGNWMVSGLILKQGDNISVTAQSASESISTAAMTWVQ